MKNKKPDTTKNGCTLVYRRDKKIPVRVCKWCEKPIHYKITILQKIKTGRHMGYFHGSCAEKYITKNTPTRKQLIRQRKQMQIKKIKRMKKLILGLAIGAVVMFMLGHLIVRFVEGAIETSETYQCHKLQRHSTEFEGFYITQNEKAMCDDRGVFINAPVF
jgi:hypothetical protein